MTLARIFKASLHIPFTHAFSALNCVFQVLTLIERTNGLQCGKRIAKSVFHLITLLGAYLGTLLSQVNRVKRLNKRLNVLYDWAQ